MRPHAIDGTIDPRYHLGRFQEELRAQTEAEKAAFVRMAEEFKIP